eukprot:11424488-Heterocapsa_arctica.AAC.1
MFGDGIDIDMLIESVILTKHEIDTLLGSLDSDLERVKRYLLRVNPQEPHPTWLAEMAAFLDPEDLQAAGLRNHDDYEEDFARIRQPGGLRTGTIPPEAQ